jgi:DNA-dependent RNA polymerase auxiliary subunit epsilon
MNTIDATIERAKDGTFSVHCNNEIFSGMGDSAEAAKQDMLQQMEFLKKINPKLLNFEKAAEVFMQQTLI